MKRFFACCLSLMLLCAMTLTGCSGGSIDRAKQLQDVMKTCDAALYEAFPDDTTDFSQIEDFISDWAEDAGLSVTSTQSHYMVVASPASKGRKDADVHVLQYAVDPAQIQKDLPQLSLLLTALLGPEDHGRIKLVLTQRTDTDYTGAADLTKKALNGDHLLHLQRDTQNVVYTQGAFRQTGTLSRTSKRVKPQYTESYEIRFETDPANPYAFSKHQPPNPAEVLGDLLASAKSSGRLFEIASFDADGEDGSYPSEAACTVVIDENNVDAFTKRFQKSYDAVKDKYDKADAAFTYTMEETKRPGKVLKQSASDTLISLMYTLQTGISQSDTDLAEVAAASFIQSLHTGKKQSLLTIDMRSVDTPSMEEMSGNYQISAGLCDVSYQSSGMKRIWSSDPASPMAEWFAERVNVKESMQRVMIESSECDLLQQIIPSLDIISYHTDGSHREELLTQLIEYLDLSPKDD